MNDATWPKHCGVCGSGYDADAWERLPYKGLTRATLVGMPADLEHRSCDRCGNDMAQPTPSVVDVVEVKRAT